MRHREERELTIALRLSAEFDEDYDGDGDGYAWHERFERDVKPALVRAVFDALRSQRGYRVVAAPTGRTDAVEIGVEVTDTDAP